MARIVFFGTPLFARQVLQILYMSHQVLCVVTQPDRPFGRRQELKASEVKEYALLHKLPIFQPQKLDESLLEELKKVQPDFFVVVAFGQIFPQGFLSYCPCINLHASILPSFRGASPLQEMILQDEKYYGVSVMKMDQGLDCGDILGIRILKTQEALGLLELSEYLSEMGGKLLAKVLEHFALISPLKQNDCDATLCKKIQKSEGEVTFANAREVFVKFLALTPWPSIFLSNGLKLCKLQLFSLEGNYQEGEILEILEDCVLVGCKQGKLQVFEVQPPSKQKMSALSYLRGKHLRVGEIFC